MPAPASLVHQTTVTAGSGNQTLTAVNGRRTFTSVFGTGGTNVFDYFMSSQGAAQWEQGTGHIDASTGALVRDTVIKSSNANAVVTFSAATIDVTNDMPAENRVLIDAANAFTDTQKAQAQSNIGVRPKLAANRTYYVRTDGSDSNNGLANTSGGAFLTIQKAINVALTLDLGGFAITVQVAAGTYTGGVWLQNAFVGGSVTLVGDTITPSNVVISTTSVAAIRATNPGSILYVQGFKLTTATTESCLMADGGGTINVNGKMEYGAAAYFHMQALNFGAINVSVGYTISGGALYHYNTTTATILVTPAMTITLTGTPAFSGAFAGASFCGVINALGHTFSGSATGTRYLVSSNGAIQTNGGGVNYFPGNAAGSTSTGGQYI